MPPTASPETSTWTSESALTRRLLDLLHSAVLPHPQEDVLLIEALVIVLAVGLLGHAGRHRLEVVDPLQRVADLVGVWSAGVERAQHEVGRVVAQRHDDGPSIRLAVFLACLVVELLGPPVVEVQR